MEVLEGPGLCHAGIKVLYKSFLNLGWFIWGSGTVGEQLQTSPDLSGPVGAGG